MKKNAKTAGWPRAAALCCAATAGVGTVLATQGWLIGRARRHLAARTRRPTAAPNVDAGAARPARRLLVVGDSTGVGIGSDTPAESLQGRLQHDFEGAEIVNRAQVGACVADVSRQLEPLRDQRFDFALVLVGGNDILRMTPLPRLADDARRMLCALRPLAPAIVWIGCADIGIAPCLIAPFSWFFSLRSRRAARRLADTARGAGVDFIDFVNHPLGTEFRRQRHRYFAPDGVHPSGYAYGRCYDVLKARPGFPKRAGGSRRG